MYQDFDDYDYAGCFDEPDPELVPCPKCGGYTDWHDDQFGGLSPACRNKACTEYGIPIQEANDERGSDK